jgi:hypothetical protein
MNHHLSPKIWIAMAITLVGVAVASPARADDRLVANVPFEFIVGHLRLPAGSYVIAKTSTPAVLAIESAATRHKILVLTNADGGKVPAQPELVFKRFEGQHFLSRINDGYAIEREIPLTTAMMSRERQVAVATVTVPLMAER